LHRRRLLKQAGAAAAVAGLAGIVPSAAAARQNGGASVDFWTMNYGDPQPWLQLMRDIAGRYAAESGDTVGVEMINWDNANQTYLLVTQGGEAPDAADMFWLYSHVQLGGGRFGPQPLTQFRDELWPDLEQRFFPETLRDVFWEDEFYGIPWRGDIRPLMYRTDFFEEVGLERAPDTWDELVEYGKLLTQRDGSGNVTRWGLALAASNPVQACIPYYWQAGGSFMTEDGRTATIDNDEMREALTFLRACVWEHQIVPPEFMEQGHAPDELFAADQYAMVNGANSQFAQELVTLYPDLDGRWFVAVPPMGPANRAAYYGAGYWGALHGASDLEAAARWIQYLSRDETMQAITEFTGNISPNISVQSSPFWTDAPWKLVYTETLAEHARTSQHPTPVWGALASGSPGSVLYDLFYAAIVNQEDLDELLPAAEQRMQDEINRGLA
jgi:multiple sugar transport system substrate-binding protein